MSFPGAQPQSPLPYSPSSAVTHDALQPSSPPSSPGSYGYPAGAPHADHSFTLPKGFVAVVVVGLVYAIGRATGLALQFSVVTGDLFGAHSTITANTVEAIWWSVCALPAVTAIPALILLSGNGTRPDGAVFARWCVLLIIINQLAFVVAFALPSRFESGTTNLVSLWADFLVATAGAAAWISTHRGTRLALLAAPVAGGLAVLVGQVWSNIINDNLFSQAAKGTAVQDSLTEGQRIDYGAVWFGTAMASIFIVLTLVAAAWLAYGIERAATTAKLDVPAAPASMWDTLTAGRYQALHLTVAALAVAAAVPAPLAFWASGAGPEDAKILYQVLLSLIVVVAGIILMAAALECIADRGRRLWVYGGTALALGLAVTRIFVASGLVSWFGMLALALAFIVALVPRGRAPLAGTAGALLVFVAPVGKANLEQNTVTVYAESTARLMLWAIVMAAAVGVGWAIGHAIDYAMKYQATSGARQQRPTGAHPGSGPLPPRPGSYGAPPVGGLPGVAAPSDPRGYAPPVPGRVPAPSVSGHRPPTPVPGPPIPARGGPVPSAHPAPPGPPAPSPGPAWSSVPGNRHPSGPVPRPTGPKTPPAGPVQGGPAHPVPAEGPGAPPDSVPTTTIEVVEKNPPSGR